MLTILLPAYNEERSLPNLLPKFAQLASSLDSTYRIVVLDDGSQDNTLELLEQFALSLPITVLRHSINRGLGETVRDLFEFAIQSGSCRSFWTMR